MRLQNLESRVFLGFVLATTALFLWMVRGFLMPVFWAVVFAMLYVYDRRRGGYRVERLTGDEGLARAH